MAMTLKTIIEKSCGINLGKTELYVRWSLKVDVTHRPWTPPVCSSADLSAAAGDAGGGNWCQRLVQVLGEPESHTCNPLS